MVVVKRHQGTLLIAARRGKEAGIMTRPTQIAALLLALLPMEAASQPVDVTSPEALARALDDAEPGTIIRLAPGNYGILSLRELEGSPNAPVVIASADPARPARLSGLTLREVAGVELSGLFLDYAFSPGDPPHLRPFQIVDSRNVKLSGVVIDGDVARGVSVTADGFPTAFGLGVRGVEGFTLEDSEIRGFFRGLVVAESSDVTILRNDLHGLRMDGMDFAQVSRVLIESNHIHDFERSLASEDHADMIQFWTNGTEAPSTDITIRNNLLASESGFWTQSIFMRNDQVDRGLASFEAMAYRRVRIEDNVIINAHLHGISVGETEGLVISGNAVLRNTLSQGEVNDPGLWTPQIRAAPAGRDVTIRGNVVAKITGFEGQQDWDVEDNLLVQDRAPSEPGHYAQVFAGMPRGDPRDPATFAPRPSGPLDGTGLGPPWLGLEAPP